VSKYLLDTDVLIDFSKQREPAASWILKTIESGDELGISPINAAEFYAGLDQRQTILWEEFLTDLSYWTISHAATRQAGRWRYVFARQGRPLSIGDLLTAAVAAQEQATLVTGNVKDYPMAGLQLLPLPRTP
jgi:predicted nucleic acid-binding protein